MKDRGTSSGGFSIFSTLVDEGGRKGGEGKGRPKKRKCGDRCMKGAETQCKKLDCCHEFKGNLAGPWRKNSGKGW